MLNKYAFVNNELIKSQDGNILYYHDISEDEKNYLVNSGLIDKHTLASALDPDEVARLEIENNNISIIWKIPTALKIGEILSFNVKSTGLFLKNNNLIIISSEPDVDTYVNEKVNIEIKNLWDILFVFQNNTTKHFIEHLKIIKSMSREIQEKVNTSMENKYLLQMFNLSEILVFYLDAINNNKAVLQKLQVYLNSTNVSKNLGFFNDIMIENEQASKQTEIYSNIFAGLMDARGTIVNNNMNVLIKNLTIINIIFLPLNLIASIGGMSEYSIMTKAIPWPISYALFFVVMFLLAILFLILINKIEYKNKTR